MPSGHGWPLPPADPTGPTAARDPPPIESARRTPFRLMTTVFVAFFSFRPLSGISELDTPGTDSGTI